MSEEKQIDRAVEAELNKVLNEELEKRITGIDNYYKNRIEALEMRILALESLNYLKYIQCQQPYPCPSPTPV